ncbi:unnamed protein product [Rotaria socialis]|uniref:RING-type domain-containing protein n=1 Tax=Rotaria socialis TaxID=392032 RepID=A0A820ZFM6_9BILA|nr:unnamed protein product [Rotaria socialis]
MISNNFYKYTDRKSIDPHLICELCNNPFIDPIVTECDHIYCRACITKYMENGSCCPAQSCSQLLSNDNSTLNRPSRIILSMLDDINVQCELCGEINLYRRNFDEHIKENCSEYRIDCPGKALGCIWFEPRNQYNEHIKACLFEKLRPTTDELYDMIKKQGLRIEEHRTQAEQEKVKVQEQNTKLEEKMHQQKIELEDKIQEQKIQYEMLIEQQKTQLEKAMTQQKIELDDRIQKQKIQYEGLIEQLENAQSENQNQKNEISSARGEIAKLAGDIDRMKSSIQWNVMPNICMVTRSGLEGVTVAGGNGPGNSTNQLNRPYSIFVDDNQVLVIADTFHGRITQWKKGEINGEIIAGGNGEGNRLDQLNRPTDVLIDKKTDSLVICDRENRRVVRWSRHKNTTQGEILIDNICCYGLDMDDQRYLYVSNTEQHEVRRYQLGDKNGTLVAGGKGQGAALNQFNGPGCLFVDRQQNVYVSDNRNHRIMKWTKDATTGIVVAGGEGEGNALTQLSYPNGLFVDKFNTLYVADSCNHRVMCWPQGAKQGIVIVGGNGKGEEANQCNTPRGLSFDRYGNLYVADEDGPNLWCLNNKTESICNFTNKTIGICGYSNKRCPVTTDINEPGRERLALHGLWPTFSTSGNYQDILLPEQERLKLLAPGYLGPRNLFINHEWTKHGSCCSLIFQHNVSYYLTFMLDLVDMATPPGSLTYEYIQRNAGEKVGLDCLVESLNQTASNSNSVVSASRSSYGFIYSFRRMPNWRS